MVKIMENPIKMDDLGVFPLFLETPHMGPPDMGMGESVFFFRVFLGAVVVERFPTWHTRVVLLLVGSLA